MHIFQPSLKQKVFIFSGGKKIRTVEEPSGCIVAMVSKHRDYFKGFKFGKWSLLGPSFWHIVYRTVNKSDIGESQ